MSIHGKMGVLVHTLEDEGGETSVRIVIPVDRHTQVLRLAHSTLTGGHFSHKKTSVVLKKCSLGRNIQNWCSTCPRCQKAAKHTGPKAPLKPLPVIQTPFHRIALDLVGPLPRTKRGHQHLLTCICYLANTWK